MSAQEIPLKADFRERARVNDIPVARLIGFEAKEIADRRATVMLAAGRQHANPVGRCTAESFGILPMRQWGWRLQARLRRRNPSLIATLKARKVKYDS
jgi:hypothetical protein